MYEALANYIIINILFIYLFIDTTLEMAELLELLIKSYFKTRHYLEACFDLMVNKEDTIKKQQVKDDMLCKYWYLMVDTPEH